MRTNEKKERNREKKKRKRKERNVVNFFFFKGLLYLGLWDASEETLFQLSKLKVIALDLAFCANVCPRVKETQNNTQKKKKKTPKQTKLTTKKRK